MRAGDGLLHDLASRFRRFQSAPACERATSGRGGRADRYACFNPRPRASGRRSLVYHVVYLCSVSIRARVRAGDISPPNMCSGFLSFNPRPRASGRQGGRAESHKEHVFQSAPACERATHALPSGIAGNEVSIRARVRAGDLNLRHNYRFASLFQSAPACERATRSLRSCRPRGHVSIRARVRAGDTLGIERALVRVWFQSAPACERATFQPIAQAVFDIIEVSIRARVRAGDAEMRREVRS